jgi:hypothetical protein
MSAVGGSHAFHSLELPFGVDSVWAVATNAPSPTFWRHSGSALPSCPTDGRTRCRWTHLTRYACDKGPWIINRGVDCAPISRGCKREAPSGIGREEADQFRSGQVRGPHTSGSQDLTPPWSPVGPWRAEVGLQGSAPGGVGVVVQRAVCGQGRRSVRILLTLGFDPGIQCCVTLRFARLAMFAGVASPSYRPSLMFSAPTAP